MTVAVVLLVSLLIVAVAMNTALRWVDRRRPEPPQPASVIVNLASGTVFRGRGYQQESGWTLTDAVLLDGKGGEQAVDGDVLVFHDAVEFVQLLP